jgi:hypothetical protein
MDYVTRFLEAQDDKDSILSVSFPFSNLINLDVKFIPEDHGN